MGTLLQVGVTTAMHSDTPVGPPVPLEWVCIAVNRAGLSGRVLAPMERVTVHQALKMITIDAAFVLGVDSLIGSIEPGKFADFVILEQDPYVIPAENIRDVQVWGTVVGGEVFPAGEIGTK
jgi:predicted amidohydrolase YtcJ